MLTPETTVTYFAIAGGLYAAWRKVLHPRVIKPCFGFVQGVQRGLHKIDATYKLAVRTEARVAFVEDELKTPLFEADANGNVARINAAFEKTFGYDPEEVLDKRWIRLLDGSDRSRYLEEFGYARGDQRFFETNTRFRSKLGVVHHVRVQVEPRVFAANGGDVRWFGKVEIVKIETGVPA